MDLASRTEADLLQEIESLQSIQKRNPSKSIEWQWASRELKPLFAEMARRQKGAK